MDIVLYYHFHKRENSTKIPTEGGTTYTGIIKNDTSIINPVIMFDLGKTDSPHEYNYAYISNFGRYYFIRDWSYNSGFWYAQMEVDALASWRDDIGDSTQYVLRSSAEYDGYIIDTLYPASSTTSVERAATIPWATTFDSGTYVVGIINDDNTAVGSVSYYGLTPSAMQDFKAKLMDAATIFTGQDWGAFTQDFVKSICNPMQYITGAKWYPFEVPAGSGGAGRDLSCGWWKIAAVHYNVATNAMKTITITLSLPKHPQAATKGSYLNLAPYSAYQLYLQPFGSYPINTSRIQDAASITCTINVDCITGAAVLQVTAGNTTIIMDTCQFAVPMQLAQISTDLAKQIIGTSAGLASVAEGNMLGAVNGIGSAVFSGVPEVSSAGANGTLAGLQYQPKIVATFHSIVPEDNADLGRPLMAPRTISAIPGYIIVEHADMSLPSTSEENRAVKNYMEGGFFFE